MENILYEKNLLTSKKKKRCGQRKSWKKQFWKDWSSLVREIEKKKETLRLFLLLGKKKIEASGEYFFVINLYQPPQIKERKQAAEEKKETLRFHEITGVGITKDTGKLKKKKLRETPLTDNFFIYEKWILPSKKKKETLRLPEFSWNVYTWKD